MRCVGSWVTGLAQTWNSILSGSQQTCSKHILSSLKKFGIAYRIQNQSMRAHLWIKDPEAQSGPLMLCLIGSLGMYTMPIISSEDYITHPVFTIPLLHYRLNVRVVCL